MSTLRYLVVVSVSTLICANAPRDANAQSGTPSMVPKSLREEASQSLPEQDESTKSQKSGICVNLGSLNPGFLPETRFFCLSPDESNSDNRVTGQSQNTANLQAQSQPTTVNSNPVANPKPGNGQTDPSDIRLLNQRNPSSSENTRPPVSQRVRLIPRQQSIPVPPNLNPNPNPLQFPTRPQEVNIENVQPLTLKQAVELAQRNNRPLQTARFQLEQAEAQLRQARAALYPTVNLQVGATGGRDAGTELSIERQAQQLRQQGLPPIRETGSLQLNGTIAAEYNIINGGQRNAQIRAAQEGVRSAQLQVEALSEQTRLDVANAYYDLQQADEEVQIAESAVRNAQQSLRDAVALEQAGLGTKFDTLRAQVQLANQNQALVKSRAQQQVNRRQIVQILSLPQSVNVVAADPVEIAGLWNLTLEESIVRAFQNRAELQQQLTQRNIAEQQRRVALAALRPQVNLVGQYNLLDVFNDGLGLADGYQVGIQMQWNLFDGGKARATAASQQANIQIAETRFADQRNQIRFQVEQAYFQLQANFQNIQTAILAVTQATEALRLARLRFQAGVGTQTEVIDAENSLTVAQGNQVRAVIDYNRALATLVRSVSNIPIPANVFAP